MEAIISLPNVIEFKDNSPPRLVNFKENKCLTIQNGTDVSTSGFFYWATVRGSVAVHKGSWYFEVTLKSKTCRIGWATDKFGTEDALGADDNSWAYDGFQQKKYHKSNDGSKYGESWARNDIIGCQLDFEQRRISYYKNGKPLGVAFGSLRITNVALYPAISVAYDSKISVNFGHNFAHLPVGCFGMNPENTPQQKASLESAFRMYSSTNEGEELICGQGIVRLATDLGSLGPLDFTPLVLAWILFSSHQWEFTLQEWICSWSLQAVYDFEQIKITVEKWKKLIKENEEVFRNFYLFVFDYLKQPKTTNIDKQEAIIAWKMVGIDKRWGIFDKWEKYWMENSFKVVTKDTWYMLIRFIEKMGSNVENYDENDSWPLAIDEFINVMKKGS